MSSGTVWNARRVGVAPRLTMSMALSCLLSQTVGLALQCAPRQDKSSPPYTAVLPNYWHRCSLHFRRYDIYFKTPSDRARDAGLSRATTACRRKPLLAPGFSDPLRAPWGVTSDVPEVAVADSTVEGKKLLTQSATMVHATFSRTNQVLLPIGIPRLAIRYPTLHPGAASASGAPRHTHTRSTMTAGTGPAVCCNPLPLLCSRRLSLTQPQAAGRPTR